MDTKKIQQRLKKFAEVRNWKQFHNPKNLVMALSVEVAELVEIFQWSNSGGNDEINDPETQEKIKEEIADIFNYLLKISDELELDLDEIIHKKIDKNEKKYPVNKSHSSSKKYSEL
tara:strand:+ start:809 stop:1156 length:348 start_codon:yes stop_codon:yes gene_type:complete